MADVKKPEPPAPKPTLAPASTSGDPAVHHLLARRDALNMHDDQGAAAAEHLASQRKLWAAEHDEISAALAGLGYE